MRASLLALCFVFPGIAAAQNGVIASQPTAEEMKQELFGVHLFGVVGFGELWNECIEPDGDTLYTIGDRQDRGKAWVPEDGVICFNYGGPDHCFNAYRDGEGFLFRGSGTTWQTTKIRENVEVCLLSDMIG